MWVAMTMVMLLSVALGGCGSGGDDDPTPVTPSPVSTATASAVPQPSVTPTPEPAFDEILLGVGASYGRKLPNGGREFTPFVLRNDGGGWKEIAVTLPEVGYLRGVTFATSAGAWAYGGRGEGSDGVLLRSDDTGRSWIDVSADLPAECQFIADMAFADRQTGYLVSRGYFSLLFFSTRDGGRTWQPIDVPGSGLPGNYAVGTRGAAAELVRDESDGLSVVRLDDLTAAPAVIAPSGEASSGGGNSLSTVGLQGWIAASVSTTANPGNRRAAIFTSTVPGEPWLEQPVDHATYAELRAIDMRDAQNGVAGGLGITAAATGLSPLVLVANADGTSWHEAPITGIPPGWTVLDVLRTRGDGGWAIATDITTGAAESAFLRSDDGGRSWQRAATRFEHDVQLYDLARNTEGR